MRSETKNDCPRPQTPFCSVLGDRGGGCRAGGVPALIRGYGCFRCCRNLARFTRSDFGVDLLTVRVADGTAEQYSLPPLIRHIRPHFRLCVETNRLAPVA